MEQSDRAAGRGNSKMVSGVQVAEPRPIAGHLGQPVPRPIERISMLAFPGTTIGRSESVCGQIGAITSRSSRGSTIGPPQDSA